jgi:type IV pilus biogenesis protein CpaD/CtpE
MRTQYMAAATCVFALTLLAGCKSETKNQTAATVDSTAAAAPAPAPAAPNPAAPVNVTLASKPGSKVSATATATHGPDSVTIVLNASGLEAGKKYETHIHTGECAKGGPVAVPLITVVAGADGTGTSTTVVALNKLSVDKPAFLQIHSPNKKPAACGDLPAHGEPNASTAMGASPGGAMAPSATP